MKAGQRSGEVVLEAEPAGVMGNMIEGTAARSSSFCYDGGHSE